MVHMDIYLNWKKRNLQIVCSCAILKQNQLKPYDFAFRKMTLSEASTLIHKYDKDKS